MRGWCQSLRAGLLTGCYPRRVGLEKFVLRPDAETGIHPDEETVAELLKGRGYATCAIGKWHVGFLPPFRPGAQGLDHYFGIYHNLDHWETKPLEAEGGGDTGCAGAARVIDGRDIRALMFGEPGARSPHGGFFFHDGKGVLRAVRSGRWKLHVSPEAALYDLGAEIGEQTDVAAAHPDVVGRLRGMFDAFEAEIAANARPVGRAAGGP